MDIMGKRMSTRVKAAFMAMVMIATAVLGLFTSDQGTVALAANNTTVVQSDSTWKYLDNNTDPAEGTLLMQYGLRYGWTYPADYKFDYEGTEFDMGYDDTDWKEGQAPFGFKVGSSKHLDTRTYLEANISGTSNRIPAYFFRTTFELENPSDFKEIYFKLRFDDAVIVYVNGTEISRQNTPSGGYTSNLEYGAASAPNNYIEAEGTYTDMSILKEGTNVISVELHQDRSSSSDIYLDFMDFTLRTEKSQEDEPEISMLTVGPGSDETELLFSWYSPENEAGKVVISKTADDAVTVEAEVSVTSEGLYANKATVTNLDANSEYTYKVGGQDIWSEECSIKTGSPEAFSFFLVGDPQIGSTSLDSDTAGWQKTVKDAADRFPEATFMVSAGDQVNIATRETEYEGYLSPTELTGLPVAQSVGNHDVGVNYLEHFNLPNADNTLGSTAAGGDYWFRYGNALFLMINSNNKSTAEHKQFMEAAIAENEDASWKFVVFHHSIYSVASHAVDTDILERRDNWVPVFDELDIDVVLMGHDHSYTRTYQMTGNEPIKDQEVDDDGAVVDPDGILYVTANSASGSKYYAIKNMEFNFAASMEQLNTPTISKIDITENSFSLETYRIDNMELRDSYKIVRSDDETPEPEEPIEVQMLTVAPGSDETELYFNWYSDEAGTGRVQFAKEGEAYTEIMGATTQLSNGKYSSKAQISGLEADTTYIYRLGSGNGWTKEYTVTTGNSEEFSFFLVGDPQIGSGSTNKDIAGWQNTITKSLAEFDSVSFMVSAGDQVNTATNETQYEGYLSPTELTGLPAAQTVGNHDNASAYLDHFNLPNHNAALGNTAAGGDYWFRYGGTLFMMLNSNNQSVAGHKEFMAEAIEANEDADWKVVVFHHSIYSVASHANDTDILNRRTNWVPVFDELDIDIVLMGHDHSYTRTYQMKGDNPLTEQKTNEDGAVIDPTGILYLTANSASGSKYYNIKNQEFTYSAKQDQLNTPTISKIDMTAYSFTVKTYRVDTMAMTDEYTIIKTDAKAGLKTAIENAKKLDLSKYTQDSAQAYQAAINAAQAVYDNALAAQKEIDQAIVELVNAAGKLVLANTTDKYVLGLVIAEADKVLASGEVTAALPAIQTLFYDVYAKAISAYYGNAAQDEINTAADNLMTIIMNLVPAPDKTELNALINSAKALKEELYTDESFDKVNSAAEAAEAVAANKNAIEDEVIEAYTALLKAMAELEFAVNVDKAALAGMINRGENLDLDKYYDAGKEELAAALANAKEVYGETSVTQKDVDAALERLTIAIISLRAIPNKDDLKALIDQAGEIEQDLYTPESTAVLKAAMENAVTVYQSETTQLEIANAYETLYDAINMLQEISGENNRNESDDTDSTDESGETQATGESSETQPTEESQSESETVNDTESDTEKQTQKQTTGSTDGKSSNSGKTSGKVKTGDEQNTAIWITLISISMIAAVIILKKKRAV